MSDEMLPEGVEEVQKVAPRKRARRRAPARWPAALKSAPRTVDELVACVHEAFGVRVPRRALRAGSDAPLAYLVHSFFEGRVGLDAKGQEVDLRGRALPPDCVVWASRGGGKTFLGALATALDMIFKPGTQVRILGGSLEQSKRMHAHLVDLVTREGVAAVLAGRPTQRVVKLRNGSCAEVLAQSEASVRGTRVQKLRCDEVDLFDRAVWDAAQLTTRSLKVPGPWGETVAGSIHSSSTMHVPLGLMWELVESAKRAGGDAATAGPVAGGERMAFRWGVVDALEACAAEEDCAACSLWTDCGGGAKERGADEAGHVSVEDARRMKGRVSLVVWESEMLCLRPRVTGGVFPELDTERHVVGAAAVEELLAKQSRVLRERDGVEERVLVWPAGGSRLVAGMDFGMRAPTVIMWGVLDAAGCVTIVDEYVQTGRTIGEHVAHVKASRLGVPDVIWCDPAGHARNDQTGVSAIAAMVGAGLNARARCAPIAAGVEAVRARLAPAAGPPTLRISAACTHLIKSLMRYRYNERDPSDEVPIKDGNDHAADALRYLVMGLERAGAGEARYA